MAATGRRARSRCTLVAGGFVSERVLVTGGAGFIGSHLCERLVHAGHQVLCLDNFFTGRKEHVSSLLGLRDFEIVRHDVIEPIVLEVDRIYHLACPASPVHYQVNPVKTVKTSVMGTIHMLGLAKRTRARLLFSSTSEVYGDPTVHPQREDYWGNVNPIGPRACYDEGKRVAETLCFDYHRQHQVDVRVARIFNTYGPRMLIDDGRVVSNFIVQALLGKDITLYGSGAQTRSFCYVDDLVTGLLGLMEQSTDIGPVNIGNPEEITIRGLAETIIALTGSKSRVIEHPLPVDDPARRCPDISRIRALTGWAPSVTLRDGLMKAIAWFETLLREGDVERMRVHATEEAT
jgi:UDP-glucuronate decarboxylase